MLSPPFACHPFLPSLQTTPGPATPMRLGRTLHWFYHIRNPVTRSRPHRHLHELSNHVGCLQVINSVPVTGIGLLCSWPQTLERSPSAVQATRDDVPPIHNRCIENPSHQTITFPSHGNAHLEQFMYHSGLLYSLYCDVSRDLEEHDLANTGFLEDRGSAMQTLGRDLRFCMNLSASNLLG
jgi:hypothetical protein